MRGVKSLDQGAAVLVAGGAIEGSFEEDRLENWEGEGRERPVQMTRRQIGERDG